MAEEGEFRYSYGVAINASIDEKRTIDVIEHEFVHNRLYGTTTYGQLVLMLDKNKHFYEHAEEMIESMFMFMSRMQERVAVNCEVINVYKREGNMKYREAIESLKNRNRNYYNHFRKLCCINGKIDTEDNADNLNEFIISLARLALNVNLDDVPFEKMKTRKAIINFFSKDENSRKYSPNRRFDILVNVLFRNNNNNNDIDSVILGTAKIDDLNDFTLIRELVVKKVKLIFSDLCICERLIKRIETVAIKQVTFDDCKFLSTRPIRIEEKNPIRMCRLATETEFWNTFHKYHCTELYVPHRINGFEDLIFYVSLKVIENNKKTIYLYKVKSEEEQFKIINRVNCTVVFDKMKIVLNDGNLIKKMVHKLPIYIYSDVSIGGLMQSIETFFYKGKYGYFKYENYLVVIIYKKSYIFISNIIKEVTPILDQHFIKCNMVKFDDLSFLNNEKEALHIHKICDNFEPITSNDIESN